MLLLTCCLLFIARLLLTATQLNFKTEGPSSFLIRHADMQIEGLLSWPNSLLSHRGDVRELLSGTIIIVVVVIVIVMVYAFARVQSQHGARGACRRCRCLFASQCLK